MGETFSIKQVSERTGLTEDAIRYYEKIGLLPSPKRKDVLPDRSFGNAYIKD